MRALIQRVKEADVSVAGQSVGRVGTGLLALVAIEDADQQQDIDWLCRKICQLRVFNDASGVMNLDVTQVDGEILAVSQFTLFASVRKGNRPSYGRAAAAPVSQPMFERFVKALELALGRAVPTGVFGADMQVSLVNDGPITIWLDSRSPE
jgi:D-tyrosyl-tRNA(Tyr) deacylase